MRTPRRWRDVALAFLARPALADDKAVLARWRVDPESWRAFLALERETRDAAPNELAARDPVPPEGMEVIVGEEAIEIGGRLHRIPRRGTPEVLSAVLQDNDGVGAPATIELQLKYPGGGTGASGMVHGPTYTRLRFPLPGPAWREARKVVAHFNRDTPGKPDFFHGTGDGSDPEDLSTCASCGFQTYKLRSQCERCGSPLQSRRWARRYGVVLTLCGLFITGLMGVVLWATTPMLLQPGVPIGGSRFSGSALQAAGVLAILGTVFVFGATALAYGVWQMATGRRNLRVVGAMLSVFSALMLLAYLL